MDEGIVERLQEAAEREFAEGPVLIAYLFGSVATGQARDGSDVDVAVQLDASVPANGYLQRSLELARRLAAASGVGGIEVLVLNEAPLPLKGRVVRDRIVLFSRDEGYRAELESRIMREFWDYEIHAREMELGFLRDIAEGRR